MDGPIMLIRTEVSISVINAAFRVVIPPLSRILIVTLSLYAGYAYPNDEVCSI